LSGVGGMFENGADEQTVRMSLSKDTPWKPSSSILKFSGFHAKYALRRHCCLLCYQNIKTSKHLQLLLFFASFIEEFSFRDGKE
jgi:hypothetical protein